MTKHDTVGTGATTGLAALDDEARYLAARSRDARFDGWFVIAVTSTKIYCRPSCPARPPLRRNITFYPTAAAAQLAGFRACKRCRPDASPGSPEWDVRSDAVGRAMRLIADGVVDREGVPGLARHLGYSERHLNRLLLAEVGAGPLALARSQRAQTARILLETTDLQAAAVAFAAGFSSVRQFNDTVREVFATTPLALRAAAARRREPSAPGTISLRLAYRAPIDAAQLLGFLARRAVPGVEAGDETGYRRVLVLPHGVAVAEVAFPDGADHVRCLLRLEDARDLTAAVRRVRRLLDLDADPVAVAASLGRDRLLAPLVAARPGLRSPGHVDGDELAVRAVVGQQVSVAAARTVTGRLALAYGRPLADRDGSLSHAFPEAAVLAGLRPADLPLPASRAAALIGLAEVLASGGIALDDGADREQATGALVALAGIGPWTAAYVRLRALGDPDVFLPGDLGVRRALERLGAPGDPAGTAARAEAWRPWRSYALHHLWASASAEPRLPSRRVPAARKERAA